MLHRCFTFLLILFTTLPAYCHDGTYDEVVIQLLEELDRSIDEVRLAYQQKQNTLRVALSKTKGSLRKTKIVSEKVSLLIAKDSLSELLEISRQMAYTEIAKVRYIKGLQIINHLYEKTLSLDHHFSSVQTLKDIHSMSNPNQYPAFVTTLQQWSDRKDKRTGFDLSTLLGNNIYTSVIHSMVSLFVQPSASKEEKENSLNDIECIVDFTLQMHNDLNTIYFETAFLQHGNEDIIADLEELFSAYTKPIGYENNLKNCRDEDDWDSITRNLQKYLDTLGAAIEANENQYAIRIQQINLQFPIDRLVQFIAQYNAFIAQGEKFYEKFWIMLDSYENESQCSDRIPTQYHEMKDNIHVAIKKFNTAYKPVGLNGSKLKQLLYGINEYQ
ncbi:hypothetical protein [Altibacter sp. HG106]|uniref:hypothetical protein n=1 Tax=Altibacter sp. HG106 TaxID=3023937 RepID=UPI00235076D3|nr:hypothetical protein [Altibacter sp. HG106]MDC7994711.1 hypothetical protein [Altibacter sp. HG106]